MGVHLSICLTGKQNRSEPDRLEFLLQRPPDRIVYLVLRGCSILITDGENHVVRYGPAKRTYAAYLAVIVSLFVPPADHYLLTANKEILFDILRERQTKGLFYYIKGGQIVAPLDNMTFQP